MSTQAVRGQYRRMARGGARVTPFEFSYRMPRDRRSITQRVELTFGVFPEVQPPTNIHVITGRNGVGKTYLLNSMTEAFLDDNDRAKGRFVVSHDDEDAGSFTGLVSVSFSAFDDFTPISVPRDKSSGPQYSTHSPVVLQEVPMSCVWKIRRNGRTVVAERPEIETFGENVEILTREVFGLEVTGSGFHRMLRDQVAAGGDFDEIVEHFVGQLGLEGQAIVRGLIAARDANGDD
ncbi:MAG: hypothetical protein E5V94_07350, partial [Mesorhizobium sp.]